MGPTTVRVYLDACAVMYNVQRHLVYREAIRQAGVGFQQRAGHGLTPIGGIRMKAYRIVWKIPEDRRVTLTLPSDFPVGEAEVIVLVQEEEAEQAPQRASLEAFFRKLDATPPSGRSKEEIDRYLEEERAS